jgi:YfiH family protein
MTVALRSPLLERSGVAHGFNLRMGGVSEGPYTSLNLGRSVGDEPERVAENLRRFARAVGYQPDALFETSQVHGADVRAVVPGEDPVAVRRSDADALVAPPGGIAIGVRIADCVPVLIVDDASGAVAAIHAGWRGTERGVVEAGVAALAAIGKNASPALRAALFPHIGVCCFEVGEDVAAQLAALHPDPASVVDRSRSKPHVDLARIVTAKLLACGVSADAIERVPGCTRCEPERFFSFRRDGQPSGRHIAAIVSRLAIGEGTRPPRRAGGAVGAPPLREGRFASASL